jgi:transglutaminase-like putative cysteine protease
MLIKIGYDIELMLSVNSAVLFALFVHPSREGDLLAPENFCVWPAVPIQVYRDMFGNKMGRVYAQAGKVRFTNSATVRDSGLPDEYAPHARQHEIQDLPVDVLPFVLPSRYCDSDSPLLAFAWNTFGTVPKGWTLVQAIVEWTHNHLKFDYQKARADRTASDGFKEGTGVCRDFTHLAITLCRCMNIPARYATGYLGDIGVPAVPDPMDFSAWFEVYLGDRWYTFDARHNKARIGRIVMARGRDASDVALTTVFGSHILTNFQVVTEEVMG